MIAIVGEEGKEPTGLMYEAVLRERGLPYLWVDPAELAGEILHESGQTLIAWLEHDPYLVEVKLGSFNLSSQSIIRSAAGAIVLNGDARFLSCAYLFSALLDEAGIVLPNTLSSIETALDKWGTHIRWSEVGIPVPRGHLVDDRTSLEAIGAELQFPVVLKDPASTLGLGVRRARSLSELRQIASELEVDRHALLVEQYIECDARDRRLLVIDGVVVAIMERHAKPGDFRANLALGGSASAVLAAEDEVSLALQATEALGLSFAGVDIARVTEVLPGREHLAVGDLFCIEANASAGLDGLRSATGIDVSVLVIDLLLRKIAERSSEFIGEAS